MHYNRFRRDCKYFLKNFAVRPIRRGTSKACPSRCPTPSFTTSASLLFNFWFIQKLMEEKKKHLPYDRCFLTQKSFRLLIPM